MATGAMMNASPEARWLVERIGRGMGLVRGQGQHSILFLIISEAGGKRRTTAVAEADAKR